MSDLMKGIRDVARQRSQRRATEAAFSAPAFPPRPGLLREPVSPPIVESPGARRAAADAPAPVDRVHELRGASRIGPRGTNVVQIERPLAELLPGVDVRADLERGLRHLAACDPEDVYPGLRPAIGRRAEELAFVDLETCGFWGCPIFLVGILLLEGGELVSRQILACDYPDEEEMLRASLRQLRERRLLVTFNGKSYDVPCFAERCAYFGVRTEIRRQAHVDVLHASRRRWKGEWEDCRLQTLERRVTQLVRSGDIPSSEIPEVYHEFARTQRLGDLEAVLHHGRIDTITTARLFAALASDPPTPARSRKGSSTVGKPCSFSRR